jgi:hypothetical protein
MHHVSHQGQQFGPYSVEQINQYLAQGVLDGNTSVWDQTTNGWMEIGQLAGVILPFQQAQPTPVQNVARPIPVTPVAPETTAQTEVQEQSGTTMPSGEKKKTNEEKLQIIKSVFIFGIAGVLVYFLLIPFGASVLDADNKPAVFGFSIGLPWFMSLIMTVLTICWVLVCVTYPFRKNKKGKKGD